MSLLHQATQQLGSSSVSSYDGSPRGLNPTPGVLNRVPEMLITGVAFLRDSSHPQGGVLVATQQAAREIKDLPAGTVIIGVASPPEPALPTGSLVNFTDLGVAGSVINPSLDFLGVNDAFVPDTGTGSSPLDWDAVSSAANEVNNQEQR